MPTVIEVNDADFEREVLQRSHEVPVVVDFWAAWCAPCRALSPVLERLAAEAEGAWVLAKMDVDANPYVASAFGIQGIPAVHAFKDGGRIAEFTGALPEPQVRRWLEQLGPSPADIALEEARDKENAGDLAAAADAYRRVLSEQPGRQEARSALARIEVLQRAASADGRQEHADPGDVDAVIRLADLDAADGDYERAFSRLLETVRVTRGEDRDRARRHLVSLMDVLAPDDPRAMAARRSLAAALF